MQLSTTLNGVSTGDRMRSFGLNTIALVLTGLVFLIYGSFSVQPFNPNNAVRSFAAISMVQDGDTSIDEFEFWTEDRAYTEDHVIMDKAPGMTFFALPTTYLVSLANRFDKNSVDLEEMRKDRTTGNPEYVEFGEFMYWTVWLAAWVVNSLLVATSAYFVLKLTYEFTKNLFAASSSALIYVLATPVLPWSTGLFGHVATGALLFICAALVYYATHSERVSNKTYAGVFLCGFLFATAFTVEHSSIICSLAIYVYALTNALKISSSFAWRCTIAGVIGGIIGLIPLAFYNIETFGGLLKVGYQNLQSFEGMKQGFLGLTYPKIDVLFNILFSQYRGLFWCSPVLVLAFFGFYFLKDLKKDAQFGALCLFVTAFYLVLNSSYFYWEGGWSTGPRHIIPTMPFLMIPLSLTISRLKGLASKAFLVSISVLSVAITLMIATVDVYVPEEEPSPFFNVLVPGLVNGEFSTTITRFWGIGARPSFLLIALATVCGSILYFAIVRAVNKRRQEQPIKPSAAP